MLHALIMAGGGGTRFWPRSRAARPKQFLTLTGDRSLLQLACDRLEAQVPPENTWVITAEQHRADVVAVMAAARHRLARERERVERLRRQGGVEQRVRRNQRSDAACGSRTV